MRPFRLVTTSWGELASRTTASAPLAEIAAGQFTGLLVRGVFSPEEMAEATARLEAESARRAPLSGSTIEMVGAPLQWARADRVAYLASARNVERACREVLGDQFLPRLYSALARVAGTAVSVFEGSAGRYAPLTLRRIPPGAEVGPHLELGQFESCSYEELAQQVPRDALFSFYLMVATPDSGGQLAVYDLC